MPRAGSTSPPTPPEGVAHGRVQFIAVGTPPDEDGSADLRYVLAVAGTIAEHMTEPEGGGDQVDRARRHRRQGARAHDRGRWRRAAADLGFDVVSNPEFLKEGAAVADCMRPDRIVIGTDSEEAEEVLREVYAPFNRNHDKIIVMDVRSAELTKYAANCMLATKISFMNEIADLAERLGADVEMVRQGIGSDQRIGYHFIYPGAGYGGSCFPKDVKALIHTARDIGFEPTILQAVEDRNDAQKTVIFEKIAPPLRRRSPGRTFALWGLAFKPNTDDMREAAARVLIEALWAAGAKVQAYDPEAMEETQRIYGDRPDLTLCGTKEAALRGADALVVMTEWQVFRAPDFELIREKLSAAGDLRRPQPLRSRPHGAEGLRLLRDRPRPDRAAGGAPPPRARRPPRPEHARPRHRGRGLHRLPRRARAPRPRRRGDGLRRRQRLLRPALKEARLAELDRRRPAGATSPSCAPISPTRPRWTRPSPDTGPFDRVIHLAAQAGVRYCIENPVAYVASNVLGFTHVLEACRRAGVGHLTYASTSSVYGANATMPFTESQGVDHPLQFYAATKRANELMAHAYSHLYRLPTTGLRFFTVYGPWGRPDMAPMLFADAILEGRPIQLNNAGRHSRDFTYVDDIVEGVIRASDRPATPDPDWDPRDPDPATLGRAVPHLQHRQQRSGRARRLRRRARGGAGAQGDLRDAPAAARRRARHLRRQLAPRARASTGAPPPRSRRACGASPTGTWTSTAPSVRFPRQVFALDRRAQRMFKLAARRRPVSHERRRPAGAPTRTGRRERRRSFALSRKFIADLEPYFYGRPLVYVDAGAHHGKVFVDFAASSLTIREAHLIEPNPRAFAVLRSGSGRSRTSSSCGCTT